MAQKIQILGAARTPVLILLREPSKEYKNCEYFHVPDRREMFAFLTELLMLCERGLEGPLYCRSEWVLRSRFVNQAGFKRAVCLDKGFQSFDKVRVDSARCAESCFDEGERAEKQQVFVGLDEIFRDRDVAMR